MFFKCRESPTFSRQHNIKKGKPSTQQKIMVYGRKARITVVSFQCYTN